MIFLLSSFLNHNSNHFLINVANAVLAFDFQPGCIALNRKGPLKEKLSSDIPVHILGRSKRLLPGMAGLIWAINHSKPDYLVCLDPAINRALELSRPLLPKATQFLLWNENSMPIRIPIAISNIRDETKIIQTLHAGRKKTLQLSCIVDDSNWGNLASILEKLSEWKNGNNWTLHILTSSKTASLVQPLIQRNNLESQVILLDTVEENEAETHKTIGASDYFLWMQESPALSYHPLESLALGTPVLSLGQKSEQLKELQSLAPLGAVQDFSSMENMITSMQDLQPHPSATYRTSLLPKEYHTENVAKDFEQILGKTQKPSTTQQAA